VKISLPDPLPSPSYPSLAREKIALRIIALTIKVFLLRIRVCMCVCRASPFQTKASTRSACPFFKYIYIYVYIYIFHCGLSAIPTKMPTLLYYAGLYKTYGSTVNPYKNKSYPT